MFRDPFLPRTALAALGCALLLTACGGGGGGSASPPPPSPPPAPPPQSGPQFQVSAATPFPANCNGAAQNGTLFINAEVEPYVAVNPLNPSNLVGVWQQDRWSNGSAQGIVTGASFDGGVTWSRTAVPFSRCAGGTAANGGDYDRATDPWITFSPNGVAYQISLSTSGAMMQAGGVSAILVSRSTDGGTSWSSPITLIRDGEQFFNDKEAITADPTDARFVYAVWDRLAVAGGGPTLFARTVDGGITWEAARVIYDPGLQSQTLNNQIAVLPDGALVNFFTQIDFDANDVASAHLAVVRSSDKGVTWSAPLHISDSLAVGARDPETGMAIRDGASLGSVAVAPNGDLIVVWQDARFSGGLRDGIAFSRSIDGGATWSTPTRVNSVVSVQAFIPTVHVRADGTIGVTYYDLRSNTSDRTNLPTEYWLATSADGTSWRESRVAGPFDLSIAPNARGLFIGDYQSLASIGAVFVPFFVQTNNGKLANRTDVFVELANAVSGASSRQSVRLPAIRQNDPAAASGDSATPAGSAVPFPQRVHESILQTLQRRAPGRL